MSRIEDLGDSLDLYEPHDEHQPTISLQAALDTWEGIPIGGDNTELRIILDAAKRVADIDYEAAAKAVYESDWDKSWDDAGERHKTAFRREAKFALNAALGIEEEE